MRAYTTASMVWSLRTRCGSCDVRGLWSACGSRAAGCACAVVGCAGRVADGSLRVELPGVSRLHVPLPAGSVGVSHPRLRFLCVAADGVLDAGRFRSDLAARLRQQWETDRQEIEQTAAAQLLRPDDPLGRLSGGGSIQRLPRSGLVQSPFNFTERRKQRRSVSDEQPILAAIDRIAAHCESCSRSCSSTSRSARSRTSGEYRLGLPIESILPRNRASRTPGTVQFKDHLFVEIDGLQECVRTGYIFFHSSSVSSPHVDGRCSIHGSGCRHH